ncbi:MAG: hypothetical protein A2015_16680 [Spirochaetes bacterium GWF1_31_7]|nr:MAG: hypothetical protein A2Y30_14045 [Spirochaetes bacterium GWE1_32_154]OHD50078.1 MAG: hypothetical protein A2Y29_12090 [Spirochaetes bacterium GWE2_31_10]OHD52391.1 MAG: hypothetical protein A2015_16680 [Spirochaetes bacterium GWF1_31_7]HBD96035.1 hypothetical protein [Spirochaetia bacterium]HBI38547.1 hypothetical protein [Spirochaetia bacterium]
MSSFKVAILGCGTVGGGVARIILDNMDSLTQRSGKKIELVKILDLFPLESSKKHAIPRNLFCGTGDTVSKEDASKYTDEIINDSTIDLVVESIGGSSEFMLNLVTKVLNGKKHLVTANKALLAKFNKQIIDTAFKNDKAIGFEASVCGAIPIIKGINECFTGDQIESVSGIMNGTSNFILSKMNLENLSFEAALKQAQEKGYAEADPTLDVNGGDAGHKLMILLKIMYGMDVTIEDLSVVGIDTISDSDTSFAREINTVIKLICYSKKTDNGVYATVRPMMVRKKNFLSEINNATNAVKVSGKYSQDNIFIGQGAGSLETGSAIVSDIVFIAKYGTASLRNYPSQNLALLPFENMEIAYNIIFETEDKPGITGLVTTAIGKEKINIDTVSHNIRTNKTAGAIFSIATTPCKYSQIVKAIESIKATDPNVLIKYPKIIPILD